MIRTLALSMVLISLQSYAADVSATTDTATDEAYFTISHIRTQVVANSNLVGATVTAPSSLQQDSAASDADPLVLIDQIINLGQKIWSIVEAGKPVLNQQYNSASALPKGITAWNKLSSWQQPRTVTYSITFTNSFGMDVVSLKYRVVYVYGGSYQGRGRYLAYASVEPEDISVAWGFNLNVQASAPTVYNVGSDSSPVGAMQLVIQYTVSSPLKTVQQSQNYYLDGTGIIKQLQ